MTAAGRVEPAEFDRVYRPASSLGEVMQAARDLAELSGVDRGAGSFQRVRVDNYYRQKPPTAILLWINYARWPNRS